ncbi:MAG: hypothetical protein FWD43_05690 [Coriobacteriia bacterium]|nr:hypothetical protein [Coriobacteriia bacterium]
MLGVSPVVLPDIAPDPPFWWFYYLITQASVWEWVFIICLFAFIGIIIGAVVIVIRNAKAKRTEDKEDKPPW